MNNVTPRSLVQQKSSIQTILELEVWSRLPHDINRRVRNDWLKMAVPCRPLQAVRAVMPAQFESVT